MQCITEAVINDFEQTLRHQERAALTVKKYSGAIRRLRGWLNGKALTKERLIAYRDVLTGRFKPTTVNGHLAAINAFLSFIRKEAFKLKYLKIQKQHFTSSSKELSAKEYKRLLKAAKAKDQRLYYILLTLANTGIRVSELQYITAEAVQKGQAAIKLKGKCREVLITGKIKKELKAWMKKTGIIKGSLFITRGGKPMDRSNICRAMKQLCGAAKVDRGKVFPHNFRHLFARCFYAVEKSLVLLSDILGHSSIETTRIYVRSTARRQKNILKQLRL